MTYRHIHKFLFIDQFYHYFGSEVFYYQSPLRQPAIQPHIVRNTVNIKINHPQGDKPLERVSRYKNLLLKQVKVGRIIYKSLEWSFLDSREFSMVPIKL